jgi:[CysO sulfur-carrier protein]-S-L-cysteine hydrolase
LPFFVTHPSYPEEVLQLSVSAYGAILGHVYDGAPFEACGLLGGTASNRGDVFYATSNDSKSTRVYTIPPRAHLRAEREAEDRNMMITGVVHSHTHTDPYPSPTDISQAPDPAWHYVIVSLRDESPMLRSYRIVDGIVTEEPVSVV